MKINRFRKMILDTAKLFADKPEELEDFEQTVANIDILIKATKTKKGKELISTIEDPKDGSL